MNCQSEVAPLKSVLLKDPQEAFLDQKNINEYWKQLNYLEEPTYEEAAREYAEFEEFLSSHSIKVHKLIDRDKNLDAIYTRDASIATNHGMIICNMGKGTRVKEPQSQRDYFLANNIPIKGEIVSPGTLEGGDVAWIDDATLAVARGYRTNDEGIRQLKELVKDVCDEVVVFHSPHYKGPSDVFHLMSVYSPVAEKLAVVYSPLMPVSFREDLLRRGVRLIEVPEAEFDSLGCNVLAIEPKVVIMVKGNPQTRKLLEEAGVKVWEYSGYEISLKGCGGPTCLTRPLERN